MGNLLKDLRYGFRLLTKNPGFTVMVTLTLGLGIGANTAIFSVIDAVLVDPFPYPQSERLVLVHHSYPSLNLPNASMSPRGYLFYTEENRSFESMGVMTSWNANLTGEGEAERVQGALVSASLLATLGVNPILGRAFRPEEDEAGADRVVMLSEKIWKRRYGSDPNMMGNSILINGESYTVVGVMPAGFNVLFQAVDVMKPLGWGPDDRLKGSEFLICLARLKPGVTLEQARANMDSIAETVRNDLKTMPSDWGIVVKSLRGAILESGGIALVFLYGAVALVLLIACANVANLLLARASSRDREIAIRAALGAGRWRLARQMLTESVLLALLGGAGGLLLAYWILDLIALALPGAIAPFIQVGIDSRVLIFTLVVSLATGLVFGLIPALQASRPNLNESLKEGGRGMSAGTARSRMRRLLVISEVAVSVVLLVGAGLLVRSFNQVQKVHPGLRADHVLAARLSLPEYKYPEEHQKIAFYRRLLEEVQALPGVESAGAVSGLPLSGSTSSGSFSIDGFDVAPGRPGPHGDRWTVTAGYFETMGFQLLKGRFIGQQDTDVGRPVVVIDQTLANRYFSDKDPIGQRLAMGFEAREGEQNWREVVGVVAHVKHAGLDTESRVQYYIPFEQSARGSMALVARTASEPRNMLSAVRGVVANIDPDQPIYGVTTMAEVIENSLGLRQFTMILMSIFGAVALALAAVGLYGVLAYTVSQRTHEIGVRMALGAQPPQILRLILNDGMKLTLIGSGVGLVLALLAGRLLSSQLFGIGAGDPLTFFVIVSVLCAVSFLACLIPARRATRVDPIHALRYE